MRPVRGRLAGAALAALALMLGAPNAASAHDGGCDAPGGGCHVASGGHGGGSHGRVRTSSGCVDTAWDRYARRRGFRGADNGGWGAIRGHLTGKQRVRRAYLRGYFLRRYPLIISGTPYYGRTSGSLVDDLNLPAGGGIVIADPIRDEAAPQVLGPIERLNRGMARFHYAEYAAAGADFDAALSARGDLHGARIGRLLCSVIAGELRTAGRDLERLALDGQIQRNDRLALGEVFGRTEAFPALLEGLKLRLSLRAGDPDANLLTAWALIASGKVDEAAPLLKIAARRRGGSAAWHALSGAPELTPAATTPRPAPRVRSAPVRPSRDVRAPESLPPIVAEAGTPS